ncbi:MAG TPA: hypothetical protein VGF94_29760 [Kofleriaceae bacterium]|jgi:long-subunit fatty acid transport protein
MSRAFCIAVSCALAAHAANADAQPRTDPTAGRAVFTGATTPNATSIELNPAALDLGKNDEGYVAVTGVIDQLAIHTRTLDLMSGTLSPGPDVSTTTLAPGGMAAYVWHIQRIATLGFDLASVPVAAAPSGMAALQYHELALRERTYSGAIAASVRISDDILFGASISDNLRHLHLRYARDVALAQGHGPLADPQNTEIVDVDVHQTSLFSSENLRVNLGLVVQVVKDVFVGVAYHTVPGVDSVTNAYTGNMVVQPAPAGGGGLARGGAEVIVSEPASVDGEIRARLPAQLDLHVGVRWEDLSRFTAYDVRGYGTALTEIGEPEWTLRPLGYHDPVAVWAGVEQIDLGDVTPWRFGARIGAQKSAVPDAATSPLAVAPLSFTADVGVQLRVPYVPWVVQLTYGVQYFPTVHVANSVFDPRDAIDCAASGYDYSTQACASTRNGYAIDTAAGDYSRWEHAIRISLRYEH